MTVAPLHHASLTVTDLDRSVAFYEDVLGLHKAMESPLDTQTCARYLKLPPGTTGRMAMLQADRRPTGSLELLEFTPPLGRPSGPKRPGDPGIWMIAFEIVGETMEQIHARLTSKGIAFWSDVTLAELRGYPSFPMVLLEDPDGTLVELIDLPDIETVRAARQAPNASSPPPTPHHTEEGPS